MWKDFTLIDVKKNTVFFFSNGKEMQRSWYKGVEFLLGVGRSEDRTIIHENDVIPNRDVVAVNQEKHNTTG